MLADQPNAAALREMLVRRVESISLKGM
jgi:hypothetical protein